MESNEGNKPKRSNPWLLHVNQVKKDNPSLSYKEVLKLAKESYKPVEKPVKVKKMKTQN